MKDILDFCTPDRIKKFSIILAHLLLMYWVLYIVFHTNSIELPFIILNYLGMFGTGALLMRIGPKDA